MRHIVITTLLSVLSAGLSLATDLSNLEPLLQELDCEMRQADVYLQARQHAIDSAKTVFFADTTSVEAAFAVGNLYAAYQCDSAFLWLKRTERLSGGQLTDKQWEVLDRIKGRKEGYEVIYPHDTVFSEELSHQFAVNACYRGLDYKDKGDTLNAVEWLAKAALADIRLGITDNGACWQLATLLSEQGDLHCVRAYDYIEYSCRNEEIFNAVWRYIQIGPAAHSIAKKFRKMIGDEYQTLRKAFIITSVTGLMLIIVLILFFVYLAKLNRMNRKMKKINQQLDEANKELDEANKELDLSNKELDQSNKELSEMNQIREHYICAYLEEKSASIRQLYKESQKAGSPGAEEKFRQQLDDFYRSFDTTFLRLYPNFVDHINSLLRLDSQFVVPKGTLTPELRIFALIRLGITRSTRIAELLCLSNNTVYNYRSRVKNLAAGNRDEFEDTVRNI